MRVFLAASAFAFLLLWPASVEARSSERQRYEWSELAARINGRKVAFVLPDGTEVKGKVLRVEAGGLRMNVSGTSNPSGQPKGQHFIPARSVSVLRILESGKKWRIICTIATPILLVSMVGLAMGDLPEPGASGEKELGAAMYASLGGGYLLGWALDKKETEVEIIHR